MPASTPTPEGLLQEFDNFKDIANSEIYPHPPFPWEITLIILAALVLGYVTWKQWKKRSSKEIQEPIKSPAQIALLALEALNQTPLIDQGKLKEFTYEVNIILRRYLEGQFSIRSPEQTTEEFLASREFQRILNTEQKEILKKFLEVCDLIKYAGKKSEYSEINDLLDQAKKFIRQSEFALDSQMAKAGSS